ncbi:unnamed protein product [Nezara viridula]|uniref:Uncharacterized protein n=1 Tax=Nezara viridula TaxID=85310 RepID=A0A9P0EEN4_NEZVI|nr:unnamed protein product [Nezara viridula]
MFPQKDTHKYTWVRSKGAKNKVDASGFSGPDCDSGYIQVRDRREPTNSEIFLRIGEKRLAFVLSFFEMHPS